jgi:ferrous iron transport protein B
MTKVNSGKPTTLSHPVRIAVLGNPNTGKSTLFNALTGVRQQTGNYPGVTVENRVGHLKIGDTAIELVDLPGTYSLAPRSPDEIVTVNVLLGNSPATKPPDLILCVVDASNLQRNLFLVSQVLDLHRPTVIAVNMIDVAARQGQEIELNKMAALLGVPVVGIQAKKRLGFDELKAALLGALCNPPGVAHNPFDSELNQRLAKLEAACPDDCHLKRFAVTRMLFDTDGFMTEQLKRQWGVELADSVRVEQANLESSGRTITESESHARYDWIKQQLGSLIKPIPPSRTASLSHRLDIVLTHPVGGLLIAAAVLVTLFQLVFWAAEPASLMIDQFNGVASSVVSQFLGPGALNSLLTDGLINGVGGVLVFLPQILLLFFILAVLEDSGYLARAAFLMDRYLSRIGLSGITLFPLLSSFACAIPGIMATRVIKNERERMITILIAPLMSCSARLPIYVLLIAAFVPNRTYLGGLLGLQGLTMLAMYLVGIVVAIAVAWLLKKTILSTGSSSFVMELPSYKIPSLRNIWQRMFDGGWAFVRDAGTLIVLMTIVVWAAGYFPRSENNLPADLLAGRQTAQRQVDEWTVDAGGDAHLAANEQLTAAQNQIDAWQLRNSYLGRAGRSIEPIVKPLGWDWRIGSAAIASFPAREVVVSTMGVIFGLGAETDEESMTLRQTLVGVTWENSDKKLFTLPVALSIMVFFALCAQCVSTLAVIRRETNSWRWPIFTFVYMTVLAYIGALITFQLGNWIS